MVYLYTQLVVCLNITNTFILSSYKACRNRAKLSFCIQKKKGMRALIKTPLKGFQICSFLLGFLITFCPSLRSQKIFARDFRTVLRKNKVLKSRYFFNWKTDTNKKIVFIFSYFMLILINVFLNSPVGNLLMEKRIEQLLI